MSIWFKELIITDLNDKVSKKIQFVPDKNLIVSDSNGKGKSTIMKSLYHALGANSAFDDNINKKAMLFDLRFESDRNDYRILRFVDQYVVFKNNKLTHTCKYGEIISLAEFYKNELSIYVYLKDRKGGLPIAPPAYLFIPYYLDQDYSWKKEQMPFDNLGQYERISRNQLYYYHLAIFSDQYNETKSKYKEVEANVNSIKSKREELESIYMRIKEQVSSLSTCINDQEIDILINDFSHRFQSTFVDYNNIKNEIYLCENEKSEIKSKIKDIEKKIKILETNQMPQSTSVECPKCGYVFEISLEEEIKALYNKSFLENRKEYYVSRTKEIDKRIIEKKSLLEKIISKINENEKKLLNERTEYEMYSRRKASDLVLKDLLSKINALSESLNSQQEILYSLKETLNKYETRTAKINTAFRDIYIDNLHQLRVKKFNVEKIKAFYKLAIGGSQYVRSTLAFFYTFIELKERFNKDKFVCPLIIDSPREGEQDDMNSKKILEFIFDKHVNISEHQLIVASVNGDKYLSDNEYLEDINIIRLDNDDNQVMTKEEYQKNIDDILEAQSFLDICLE